MVSAAAAPAAIASAMPYTAPTRLLLALMAVASLRELAVVVVAGIDVLDCSSHALPSKPSRFRTQTAAH